MGTDSDEKTVDVQEETDDVKTADVDQDEDDTEPPRAEEKKSPRRIRLPSKMEIIKAVEEQETENLEVDPLTKEDAQVVTVSDPKDSSD